MEARTALANERALRAVFRERVRICLLIFWKLGIAFKVSGTGSTYLRIAHQPLMVLRVSMVLRQVSFGSQCFG